jgi:hypothetical protein
MNSTSRKVRSTATRALVAALLVGGATPLVAVTYYVRPDGGSAAQCTGIADAPYPGSGSAQPCAWNHPFQALPPSGAARIAGGDTLWIRPGSYRIGYGAPGAESCDALGSYDCTMQPVPSGSGTGQRTRILGGSSASRCLDRPELWGAERPWWLVSLNGSSHVELGCLELTDHSACIEFHNASGLPCPSCTVPCNRHTPPYGDWAALGLYAADSGDVRLTDLWIHGLAEGGVRAGRLTDWTIERVRIVANGWVGWDGDLGGPSSNSGDLAFRHLEVAWNGCAETWPGEQVRLDTCWAQEAGGYGDGIGLADSAGHWILEDSWVHHNTSDGIDLLYLVPPSSVEVRRVIADGNAGNQLKVAGPASIVNTLLVGDCAFFSGVSPLMTGGDHCRAYGAALALAPFQGDATTVVNSTLGGQGDCLAEVGCRDASCDGNESVVFLNDLFSGDIDWRQPWENTCLTYVDNATLPSDPTAYVTNLFWQLKDDPCPGSGALCGQNPLLADATLASFDPDLLAASPARDAGTAAGAPADDLWGRARSGAPDLGAAEYGTCFIDGFETGTTARWSSSQP